MPGPFAITAATNTIRLDNKRQAQTSFTVFNNSGRLIRGRALLVPQSPMAQAWMTLAGDAEREFAIAGTQQYAVQIAVPPEAPAGSYPFRLDVVGVENPDEQLSEGPTVQFEVPAPVKPQPKFPVWIPIAAVAALLLVAVLAFVLLQGRQAGQGDDRTPTVQVVVTAPPAVLDGLPPDALSKDWRLHTMLLPGEPAIDGSTNKISVRFEPGGVATGSGGCNTFKASYTSGTDGSLTIENISSTRRACPRDIMTVELGYFEGLRNVTGAQLGTAGLELLIGSPAKGKMLFTDP